MDELKSVEFEEVPFLSRSVTMGPPRSPKMLLVLKKIGIVKTERGGGIFLTILSIICFALSIIIFAYFVLGITPQIFWYKISNKTQKRTTTTEPPPELIMKLSPELQAKIKALNQKNETR